MSNRDEPPAVVRQENGKTQLVDPDAAAVLQVVIAYNKRQAQLACRDTLDKNADRVAHFKRRLTERGHQPAEAVIVLVNVDDHLGADVAEGLMPGHDWSSIRAWGMVPYARGLADREWIQKVVETFDRQTGERLRELTGVAVVVFDHGTIAVFPA